MTVDILLKVAAICAVGLGIAHSLLGERYLLQPLLARDVLSKWSSDILRFAWHITSVAWIGFAGILLLLAEPILSYRNVAMVVAVTFVLTGTITLYASRGRHLAWPVFLFIGAVAFTAARF